MQVGSHDHPLSGYSLTHSAESHLQEKEQISQEVFKAVTLPGAPFQAQREEIWCRFSSCRHHFTACSVEGTASNEGHEGLAGNRAMAGRP
jgi:hypothetical protein